MKTPEPLRSTTLRPCARGVFLVAVAGFCLGTMRAEEKVVPATAPTPAAAQRQPIDSGVAPAGAAASSTNAPGGSADAFLSGGILTTGNSGATDDSPEAVLQRRRKSGSSITNVVPRSVASHGGILPYVARERKASSVLQLFNPFAPASMGTGTAARFEWRPGSGTAPLPRAFMDERTHEAEGILVIGIAR